jgi:hypothetical protein
MNTETGSIERAIMCFRENRKMAEEALLKKRAELANHRHGIFCHRWRWCRKLESALSETEKRIQEYLELEAELAQGKVDRTIKCLNKMADEIRETPWETIRRISQAPRPASKEELLKEILSSPNVVSDNLRKLADELGQCITKTS